MSRVCTYGVYFLASCRCVTLGVSQQVRRLQATLSSRELATIAHSAAAVATLVPSQAQLTEMVQMLYYCHIKQQVLDLCRFLQLTAGYVNAFRMLLSSCSRAFSAVCCCPFAGKSCAMTVLSPPPLVSRLALKASKLRWPHVSRL